MKPHVIEGDLLEQQVEVIVNAWNRNVIPWWLLLPQGVSGAIKKHAVTSPFREVARHGPMQLGSAVLTGAGKLPYRGIIHVAGINLCWMATANSIRQSVISAMTLVNKHGFASVAFPLIGAGSGNRSSELSLRCMLEAFEQVSRQATVVIVCYKPALRM